METEAHFLPKHNKTEVLHFVFQSFIDQIKTYCILSFNQYIRINAKYLT